MPRRKVTPEIIGEMKRLRMEGLSYGKIAIQLGLAPMTVYNHLRKGERPGFVKRLKLRLSLK